MNNSQWSGAEPEADTGGAHMKTSPRVKAAFEKAIRFKGQDPDDYLLVNYHWDREDRCYVFEYVDIGDLLEVCFKGSLSV